eukprot:Hpha_TRINITY_DN15882_c1_g7::TRINITY_DN15882_c1_g7_i2::g.189279::m.189279
MEGGAGLWEKRDAQGWWVQYHISLIVDIVCAPLFDFGGLNMLLTARGRAEGDTKESANPKSSPPLPPASFSTKDFLRDLGGADAPGEKGTLDALRMLGTAASFSSSVAARCLKRGLVTGDRREISFTDASMPGGLVALPLPRATPEAARLSCFINTESPAPKVLDSSWVVPRVRCGRDSDFSRISPVGVDDPAIRDPCFLIRCGRIERDLSGARSIPVGVAEPIMLAPSFRLLGRCCFVAPLVVVIALFRLPPRPRPLLGRLEAARGPALMLLFKLASSGITLGDNSKLSLCDSSVVHTSAAAVLLSSFRNRDSSSRNWRTVICSPPSEISLNNLESPAGFTRIP